MRKYTIFSFATGDFKAVERYLNQQAEKGWELEKVGALFARWRKTERTDLRWCVDLVNPKENNDRDARKDYVDLCAEGGWELLTIRNGAYIFRSMPGWDPPPVQTDPDLERKNYNKYYVRSTILSVVYILAMVAFYAFLYLSMNRDLDYAIQSTKMEWHVHWMAAGSLAALPLWGVWALWRVADFIRAMAANRKGGIAVPPRWVMWTNCVVSLLGGLGAVCFFLGLALEGVVQGELQISVFVWPAVWAAAILIRAAMYEFELYRGERRFTIRLGLIVLAVFAAMVIGRVALPYGEWSTNRFDDDRDYDGTMAQYELLETAPVVRCGEFGMRLEEMDYLDLVHEYTPVGERWEVEYTSWDSDLSRIGCETILCPTYWQAELAASQMLSEIQWWSDSLNREGMASYIIIVAPPQVEMEAMTLDWADEAWYGENKNASVLVVRVGKQVTRISAPMSLWTEENLSVIQARLCR